MSVDQNNWFSKQIETPTSGFFAKLTSPKVLIQVLKVLNFVEDVTVNVGPNGLKITGEISKSFQASAFIQRETFMEYSVSEEIQEYQEDTIFNISLPTLIHCLNLCGAGVGSTSNAATGLLMGNTNIPGLNLSSTSMILYYPEVGQPLRIWLEEDGVISGMYLKHAQGGVLPEGAGIKVYQARKIFDYTPTYMEICVILHEIFQVQLFLPWTVVTH